MTHTFMQTKPLALFAAAVLAQTLFSARAAEASPADAASAPAAAAASTPAESVRPKGQLAEKQVPKLALRWDCGECEKNEKVPPLIEQTYSTRAASQGYAVSDAETAELAITDYRQRPPGVRVMFGIMAGKDRLGTRLTFRGKDYEVKDYSANAFQGMNSLCDAVAQEALKRVLDAVKAN